MSVQDKKGFDEAYKGKVITGSTFPGKPYSDKIKVVMSPQIFNEYVPIVNRLLQGQLGFSLLLTAMTSKEGFTPGTRSYLNNNPGNIGNTDGGSNRKFPTLDAGVQAQIDLIQNIVDGKVRAYPIGKQVSIPPSFSDEIARNTKTYGMSPWLPGYKFVFTGQLDQFVKIYSTGARAGNSYINHIVSWFKMNGLAITPESTLQEIILLK